ncbi:MAG TPA: secondary thiamine-phosphate synthase enzyme YjbQ [Anaerolineales bacterium]
MIRSQQIELQSEGHFNVIVLTDQVQAFVTYSGLQNGQVSVFFQHTTGAVIIEEYETGILADLVDMFERIAPTAYPYKHHLRAVDYNGHAHMRLALMQPGVVVPVIQGKLGLGTYQDILVIDDQIDQDPRYVILQVMGE